VSDTYNNMIKHFTTDCQYLGGWSIPGDASYPDGLDMDPEGNLWIALTGQSRVAKFTQAGTELVSISTWEELDSLGNPTENSLYGARGVAVDPWGAVYVASGEVGQVARFDEDGQWLSHPVSSQN
jgi:streptogramin lyase